MEKRKSDQKYDAIVIGASAGGLEALTVILPPIPASFKVPIIIVQHMHAHTKSLLTELLANKCNLRVREAEDKDDLETGTVYFSPPNYHLLIENDRALSLSTDERVNYSRPSIDVLFESAAEVYMERLVGLILTGANSDGSAGLKKIKDMGGLAVVQDPATANIATMPKSAIESTKVDHIIPLDQISKFLINLIK